MIKEVLARRKLQVIFKSRNKLCNNFSFKLPQFPISGIYIKFHCVLCSGLYTLLLEATSQKIKFSIKDFFSKCKQIRRKLRTWSYLLQISLMENFIFCAVNGEHIIISRLTNKTLHPWPTQNKIFNPNMYGGEGNFTSSPLFVLP